MLDDVRLASRRLPLALWLYFGVTATVYALSQAPSSVHTSYTWWGVAIEVVLLWALLRRSVIARRVLIFLGVLAAFGGIAVQGGGSLDVVATSVSVLELIQVGLLLTPAARRYTSSAGPHLPQAA
jgi:hypothetical protein